MQPSMAAEKSESATPASHTRASSIDKTTIRGSDENVTRKAEEAGVVSEKGEKEDGTAKEVQTTERPEEVTFPDGGFRAWLVALGVGCGIGATFGFVNAWGVFQAYYEETMLPDTPPSTIAWIGSTQYALVFIPGLLFGRLFDMGYFKGPLLCASAVLVAATFLVAECTEFWQFMLCQGLAVGFACGTIFGPTLGILPHWFKRKLGIAYGLTATGSSVGGALFPIATRNLIEQVGFKWTMRILGFILLFLLGICNLTTERRLPPKKEQGPFLNFKAFRNPAFTFYSAAAFVNFLGLYTVLTYIDVSAQGTNVPENLSFYLLPIANAGSLIGRIVGGFLADRFGPLNVITPANVVAGIMTFAWPFAGGTAGYVVIAILYGMSSGIFASLVAPPIVSMGEIRDVGARVGMAFTFLALGALAGPPISGAIQTATGSYKAVGYYAGTTIEFAVILLMICRYHVLGGKFWGKC
ncbi:MFS general substrate transporter [Fomitopsis serialis]|uniref:MFS general substrate transporter n=1 Tax=Fomitopsis serialis TaxID=139415 RepID=UPI002007FF03|nr:MFS general substrate transporter [Neoantrodia serialis]KAH9926927.1 MFS general substrate transporter [Neoantrodia serialis]